MLLDIFDKQLRLYQKAEDNFHNQIFHETTQ
jgi:hypothetical protein